MTDSHKARTTSGGPVSSAASALKRESRLSAICLDESSFGYHRRMGRAPTSEGQPIERSQAGIAPSEKLAVSP
jgi:hypothetical protein